MDATGRSASTPAAMQTEEYAGDHTWATMLGQSVRLQPVPIQSLSELERARLQEVACYHLEDRELDVKIRIPKETNKRRKSIRRKFDSFSKEKKERESAPKAFGIPLSQVIANDRAFKQRQDALKESRRDCLDLEASVLHFRAEKSLLTATSPPPSSATDGGRGGEPPNNKPQSPTFLDNTARVHRRGGLSVDSISDLVESQSRLLEALQLSHPAELELKKCAAGSGSPGGRTQTKLSLNPIYRQVPRVLERCCGHIESYGLQTVGIFRVGSSKKRVRQLRDEFDMGADLQLDEEQSVHDVAALLKEFLREMPDPLLSRELYPAFLHANLLRGADQLQYLQHLLYLLPPCNCDTLLRLLTLLHTVQGCAQDSTGPNDEEVSGNKMTAANLAVIFGPNLLQGERGGGGEPGALHSMGIEDSNAIINVTLVLVQNHKTLFTVSAELQQEVLMSLIQTDPDIIDYLLRRKLSGSHLTVEGSTSSSGGGSECGGRRDTAVSLDSVGGASSGSLSPLEPPSPLFPPDSSLSSEVFLNVLKLNHNRKRQEARYTNGGAELAGPGKSIRHTRQFHSHHNLLSLVTPPSDSSSDAADHRRHPQDGRPGAGESSIWVRQATPLEEEEGGEQRKPSSAAAATNFWDFFTGKGLSGSETIV